MKYVAPIVGGEQNSFKGIHILLWTVKATTIRLNIFNLMNPKFSFRHFGHYFYFSGYVTKQSWSRKIKKQRLEKTGIRILRDHNNVGPGCDTLSFSLRNPSSELIYAEKSDTGFT